MDENVENLIAAAEKSLAGSSFIKLVLSNYKGANKGLQRISVRIIDTKRGPRLMFQSRFETRDVVKNFTLDEGIEEVRSHLGSGFRNAHLFTSEADLQLSIGKRNSRLITGKPSAERPPPAGHDRVKHTMIDPAAFYLKALGISGDNGEVKPSQQDKWRQVNKFVEILVSLIEASPLKERRELKIVDMGSGKGYLTFAVYDHLVHSRGTAVRMTGVEARANLVDTCNDIARAGGFDGLNFVQGQIEDFDPVGTDILIALHACDTATDDALYKGIMANAAIIVAAPCCHKEVRKQIRPPDILAGILKHGVMLERTAETLTDGLRALILERQGYSTKLFEFVPTEHTPKNNMLTAVRHSDHRGAGAAAEQIRDIQSSFGIRTQRLDELLGAANKADITEAR